MKKTILTTAIQNFNSGMVADGNGIEFPPNSAKVLKNVDFTDTDVIRRRSGIAKVSGWTGADGYYRTFVWEYAPGVFALVNVDHFKIAVRDYDTGTVLNTWGSFTPDPLTNYGAIGNDYMVDARGSNEISYTYTKEVPTGAAAVASTSSEFYNQLAAARAAGTVTVTETSTASSVVTDRSKKNLKFSFAYSGNTYIREQSYNSTAPSSLVTPVTPVPCTFSSSPGSWYQFAQFKNTCVVTSELGIAWVLWAEYDTVSTKFFAEYVNLNRRLYEDVSDGVGVDEQPVNTLSNSGLNTNLLNRGWIQADIDAYKAAKLKWPSKSMVPWLGKDGAGVFSATVIDKVFFGSTSAPTGKSLANVYSYDKSGVTAVCSAFGRYFYGGFSSNTLNGAVMYSQIITKKEFLGDQVGACYSINDPTAEVNSEGTAIDGGYILIEGASKILKIMRFKDGVLVFARNGVWYITGLQGQIFQGNAFNLYKLTDKGILNGHAAAELDETIMYASDDGVYGISVNPQTRSVAAINLTDDRISDLFKTSLSTRTEVYTGPFAGLRFVEGPCVVAATDRVKKEIFFILGKTDLTLSGGFVGANDGGVIFDQPDYNPDDVILIYDLRRGAWRYYTIGDGVTGYNSYVWATTGSDNKILFRDYYGHPYTFSRDSSALSNNYKDDVWTSENDDTILTATYPSLVDISAKNAMVDPDKQITAVHTHFQNSDYKIGANPIVTGSCYMSVLWDSATDSNTVRHSSAQQAYRNVPYREATVSTVGDKYSNNHTRLIVRGHGRQFTIRYESDGVADFKLIGYAIDVAYPTRELQQIIKGGG